MTTSFELAVIKVLMPKIEDERQKAVETIVSGRCEDHSTYRYSAGYIKALDDVKAICEQIIGDIQQS